MSYTLVSIQWCVSQAERNRIVLQMSYTRVRMPDYLVFTVLFVYARVYMRVYYAMYVYITCLMLENVSYTRFLCTSILHVSTAWSKRNAYFVFHTFIFYSRSCLKHVFVQLIPITSLYNFVYIMSVPLPSSVYNFIPISLKLSMRAPYIYFLLTVNILSLLL